MVFVVRGGGIRRTLMIGCIKSKTVFDDFEVCLHVAQELEITTFDVKLE